MKRFSVVWKKTSCQTQNLEWVFVCNENQLCFVGRSSVFDQPSLASKPTGRHRGQADSADQKSLHWLHIVYLRPEASLLLKVWSLMVFSLSISSACLMALECFAEE